MTFNLQSLKNKFNKKGKEKIKALKKEAIEVPDLFDVRAETGTLYFSKNRNKLVYKTKDGSIKELYE
jgi:hypothetical protein